MVKVVSGDIRREYPTGESIEESAGLLFIYGPAPEKVLIALHQSWDYAEVVVEETE